MTAPAGSPLAKHPAFNAALGALVCPICADPHSSFIGFNKHVRAHDLPEHLATTQLAQPPPDEQANTQPPMLSEADRRRFLESIGGILTVVATIALDMFGLSRPAVLIPVGIYLLALGVVRAVGHLPAGVRLRSGR